MDGLTRLKDGQLDGRDDAGETVRERMVFCCVLDANGSVGSAEVCWEGGDRDYEACEIVGRPFWHAPWWAGLPLALGAARSAFTNALFGPPASTRIVCHSPRGGLTEIRLRVARLDLRGTVALQASGFAEPTDFPALAGCMDARLLYGVGHDLQEPLRTIHIYAQLLQRSLSSKLDEDGRRRLQVVIDGARRMSDFVVAMLTYASLEGPPTESRGEQLSVVDASWACKEALENLRALIEETGAEVKCGDLPMVLAHRPDLPQLFQNLICNAIKHRRAGVTPQIEIEAVRLSDHWEFSVADNAIGFEQERAESLFEVFTRLRPSTSGTGFGLAICRRIVQRMGGRIWAESKPGVGSVFRFTARAHDCT